MLSFGLSISLGGFLLLLSGLFSGLTLGVMGLDKVALEVLMETGTPKEQRYARKIYPVRKRGNLVLSTLLLSNVSVNALVAIIMADVTNGLTGFLLSSAFIVTFGEIFPQAIGARYGLGWSLLFTPCDAVVVVVGVVGRGLTTALSLGLVPQPSAQSSFGS